jgi:Flp pilus assembly secretin CpaC
VARSIACILKSVPLSALVIGLSMAAATAETGIQVVMNQAKIVKLARPADTIVIGNPAIADVTIQRSGIAVVTGKAYGTTNMIVLNPAGKVISEQQITVKPRDEGTVTVQRALERETLICPPSSTCERTIKVGDAPANFDAATGQASALSNMAGSQQNSAR